MKKDFEVDRTIPIFVHLAYGFGRAAWKKRWDKGEIIGINHEDPYGYRQANSMGCAISQSEDYPESAIGRLLRLGIRSILGFDLVHAWKNRVGIFQTDVVWTHTESQGLAILCLFALTRGRKPKLIAQNVWLMDAWDTYSGVRKWFYSKLLSNADVLTFHSDSGLAKARGIFPALRSELVLYGIKADDPAIERRAETHQPLRVLSLGNDRHRDWPTFISALKSSSTFIGRIVTKTDLGKLLDGVTNITLEQPTSNEDLSALFKWADVVVVCLTDNLHASGITVVQEAVLCGIPVICSDAGALESYFTEDELTYIPPANSGALSEALEHISRHPDIWRQKASRALVKMKIGNINSRGFIARHVEISRELIDSV